MRNKKCFAGACNRATNCWGSKKKRRELYLIIWRMQYVRHCDVPLGHVHVHEKTCTIFLSPRIKDEHMQPRAGMHTLISLRFLLPFIILVEGFASIAIEILTIRQLLPVAGGSVIVTSLIIGVFLLFLALGYEKGGRIELHLHHILRRNFLIVAVWIGVGLSY